MKKPNQKIIVNDLEKKYSWLYIFFFWAKWLFPKAKQLPLLYLIYHIFFQKVLRINGSVGWPVHYTSRVLSKENITIGYNSAPGINSGCYVQGRAGIIIGNNLRMGPGCGLISANHNIDNYDEWIDEGPIIIGNNVWLGMGVVILPGVTIGDNVVIAANSVVNKNIPSNVIAGGIPCKVIKEKSEYKGIDYSNIQ